MYQEQNSLKSLHKETWVFILKYYATNKRTPIKKYSVFEFQAQSTIFFGLSGIFNVMQHCC